MTSEILQSDRKTDDRDRFTMLVSTGNMQGSESLITDIVILSWPGGHELNSRLNLVASGVFAWANLNDMALNTSKTKSILITT